MNKMDFGYEKNQLLSTLSCSQTNNLIHSMPVEKYYQEQYQVEFSD